MILKNKKTWKLAEFRYLQTDYVAPIVLTVKELDAEHYRMFAYESLAELNAEWEDYTPQETLIKDEKIRKAVRAWADANGAIENTEITFDCDKDRFWYLGKMISFEDVDSLESGYYTIAELCGEEE